MKRLMLIATPARSATAMLALCLVPLLADAADTQKQDDDRGAFWGMFGGKLSIGAMGGYTHNPKLVGANDNDGSVVPASISADKSGTGWKLFATYQPWENVGFELAYSDLGKDAFRAQSTGGTSWSGPAIGTSHEAHGWELNLYDRIPITDRFTLLAKLGLYGWESKQTYNDNGAISVDKSSGTKPTYGLGFEYDIGVKDRFFWRGELQHYTVDQDKLTSNALWIGVAYKR